MSSVRIVPTQTFIRQATESCCPQELIVRAVGEIQARPLGQKIIFSLYDEIGLAPEAGFREKAIECVIDNRATRFVILYLSISASFPIGSWSIWNCQGSPPDWRNKEFQPVLQIDGHVVHANYMMAVARHMPEC